MKLIPAIDIIDGKCVRLTEGDYATQKTYAQNPLDLAMEFQDNGITHLHLVDLDGAREGKIINWKTLETIAVKTSLTIDFGGGLKSNKDLEIAFNSGAQKITGGSIAVKNPDLFAQWIKHYPGKIILGADVRDKKIAVSGWIETTEKSVFDLLLEYQQQGLFEVICTDIAKDGKLEGPSFDLYKEIVEKFPKTKLIASGGITTMADIEKCREMKLEGVIIGKAIYEGRIKLDELKSFVLNAG